MITLRGNYQLCTDLVVGSFGNFRLSNRSKFDYDHRCAKLNLSLDSAASFHKRLHFSGSETTLFHPSESRWPVTLLDSVQSTQLFKLPHSTDCITSSLIGIPFPSQHHSKVQRLSHYIWQKHGLFPRLFVSISTLSCRGS